MNEESKTLQFIRALCKGRSEEEIKEAEVNFTRFFNALKALSDRIDQSKLQHKDVDSPDGFKLE